MKTKVQIARFLKKFWKKATAAGLAAVLAAVFLAGCGSTAGNASKTVNIGIQPSAAAIPILVAKEKGWLSSALKKQGVTVKWNNFEAGPPMNESMASGKTDIGFLGDVPAVSAIGAGQKNVLIATSAEGPNAYDILVSKSSPIQSVKDLKGKTVGTTVGSTAQNVLEQLLKKYGLSSKDVKIVNINAGDAATVLTENQADAVVFWEPTPTRLVDSGVARIIAKAGDANQLCVNPITAREAYVNANADVVTTVIKQYARGVKAIKDGDLDAKTTKAIAKYLSVQPEQVKKITNHYNYTVVTKQKDIDSLQDVVGFLVRTGGLKKSYSVKDVVTNKYVKKANIAQYLK
jgi:sulfonate transport system substrate-binding protein